MLRRLCFVGLVALGGGKYAVAAPSEHFCSVSDGNANAASVQTQLTGAEVITEWNNLTLDWIRLSERGPTISGRFAAYVNIAMYDAWASFDNQAGGVFSNESVTQLANERDAAIACAAYKVISEIGATVLNQQQLEIGVGEDAAQRLATLQARSASLLQNTTRDINQAALANASNIADIVSGAILTHALNDGANQQNNYADTMAYSTTPWVVPVPSTDDGISDYDFLGTGYSFNGFNPVVAEGVNSGNSNVHPLVENGQLRLTQSWQSLTNLGVFPPADDGGQQFPLTPHWGQVSTLVMSSGDQMRPDSVAYPYDEQGNLSDQWLREANQLLEFSAALQDGAPDSAIQRARSEYWELGDGTEYPPGWWLQRATDIATDRNLSQREALKLLLAVSVTTFEAGVASWDIKFHFDTVRPITAINELYYGSEVDDWRGTQTASTDDRDHWRPYQLRRNLTPPFPDVPSGHSSFSSSSAVVMQHLLQTNQLDYTSEPLISRFDLTDGFDGDATTGNEEASLHWAYLSHSAEEAGLSRLYGGIHMMDGNLLGLKIGTRLGHETLTYIDNLFGDAAAPMPELVFGTGLADTELVTPEGVCGPVELYGFHEQDLLRSNLGCNGSVSLFGGEGVDTFSLEGMGEIWIRDYESGEPIIVGLSRLAGNSDRSGDGSWVDGHRVSTVIESISNNAQATSLMVDGNLAARIEGIWHLSELALQIGVQLNANSEGCDYRDAHLNHGWGWNADTFQSCAP